MRDYQRTNAFASADDGEPLPNPLDPFGTAEYIRDVTAELATLARRHRFVTMAYLLDMARLEAETLLSRQ